MVADVLTRSAAAPLAAVPLSGLAGAWRRLRRRDERGVAEAVPAWLMPPPERPLPSDLDLPLRLFDPAAFARAVPGAAPAPRAMALEPLLLDETLQRLRRLVA
ncbi:hypothetical protein K7957_15435 [Sphingomonas yunnanensis]|uniref:hypothetical protein n=1 Tax=Sphingomonas yunnanensis TaxID=310400 RepID=UPI001CA63184|nr:hypothetical protein [Sphingomonas yunnanensis]MBY9064331.1 hypothetical protein [Sphingomonas yunnanensis]